MIAHDRFLEISEPSAPGEYIPGRPYTTQARGHELLAPRAVELTRPHGSRPTSDSGHDLRWHVRGGDPHDLNSATQSVYAAAELENLRRAVKRFKDLKHNWDGQGAVEFSPEVISAALAVLDILRRPEFSGAPAPEVSPETNGTISMAWTSRVGDAYLEIGKTRYAGYIRTGELKSSYLGGAVTTISSEQGPLYLIWARLYGNQASVPPCSQHLMTGV